MREHVILPRITRRMSSSADNGIFRTDDGKIDMEHYEKQWNQSEHVPGLDLSMRLTVPELLEKVKELLVEQPKLLHRDFEPVVIPNGRLAKDDHSPKKTVRVMQWNTLADALSTGKDNFILCPAEALAWSKRRLYILQEILEVNPDVLTLQEVDHFGFFKHVLAMCGYVGRFFPKPDSPTLYVRGNHGPDGCAMFYRAESFELVSQEFLVLKALPDLAETNQVAVVFHLRVAGSDQEFTVVTTHLKAKPGWELLRQQQGSYLVRHLEETRRNGPLIVCGDFNAEYTEKVYDVFRTSSLGLCSAYKEAGGGSAEPAYTTWKIRGGVNSEGSPVQRESRRAIDYIWFHKKNAELQSILRLPTGEEIGVNRLPSHSYPSDHFSLAADFLLS